MPRSLIRPWVLWRQTLLLTRLWRGPGCAGVLHLLIGILAFFGPPPAGGPAPARGWIEQLPPFANPQQFPGLQPILELEGKAVHNCGNVLLHVSNSGFIGSMPGEALYPWNTAPSCQWPSASATEYLYAAALWIGAVKGGEYHVSTGGFPFEYFPGVLPQQRMYYTREGEPGGARAPAPNADDDQDGRTDEDVPNGADDDGDGLVDEDFAAISSQMFFCEYTDFDPTIRLTYPEHAPLGVKVQQGSYCWEDAALDDFIAFDYKIINDSPEPLYDVYVGFWADCDIGPRGQQQVANDDLAAFWEGVVQARLGTGGKKVKLSLGYMFDDDGDEGKSRGYIGLAFLGAQSPSSATGPAGFVPLHNFRFFSSSAAFEQGGDPSNDEEAYAILDGTAPQSLPPPGGIGNLRPERIARKAADYRLVVSAGPFETVNPGDTLGFQAALVLGTGFDGMVENAIQAQLTYDGVWLDCDANPTTGVNRRETPVCGPRLAGQVFRIDSCDTTCALAPPSDPACYASVPADACEWINGDCEYESWSEFPTGVDGKECLIHWLVSTAPPPPRMRLSATEGRIDVLWDNSSETSPDLRTNLLDFESYRVWRADNWQRPLGTNTRIGPGAALWMLLAEFDLPRNGIGSDTGLEVIVYRPQVPEEVVEFYREWYAEHPFLEPPDLPGFTRAQIDTAKALSKGRRYYHFTDPPQPTLPPPHNGSHYFYSVTATDHRMELLDGVYVPVGPGLAGEPNSNFVYINPPTQALPPERWEDAEDLIYVVPNPATPQSLADWQLHPNNDDPTGVKIEFHNLPRARGMVTVFTLSTDMVVELPFDGTSGNGSLAWDLLSRNGQEVTSGVYLYVVEAEQFERVVGKFVIIR